jgi:glycerophosphoryl diester phosphodiesterase
MEIKKRWGMSIMFIALFITVSAQESAPIILGHRGGRAEQDENTLSAFQNAWNAGIHSFETDIHLTKDGNLVISHDSELKKMYDYDGTIENMTSDELLKLKTKAGHPFLFLDDLLKFLSDKPNLYIEFEMKTLNTKLYPDSIISIYCVKAYNAVKAKMPKDANWSMTSFDYRPLRYLRQHYPESVLMLITSQPCSDETIEIAKALNVQRLASWMNKSTRAAVRKAHKEGLKVSLWPGEKVEDTLYGLLMEADFLCTDIPIAVKKYMDEKLPWVNVKF